MKISYNWLQSTFEDKLPEPKKLAETLTMTSFEVESIEEKDSDFILDIDILPNRSHDCLSHFGIAKELGVVFGLKLKKENFGDKEVSTSDAPLEIEVSDEKLCRRYIGRVIENVEVGPSPDWLKERLESIGQKSINNIVDATNFVMLHYGQPLHAFDKDKLDGSVIKVRRAEKGETLTTLDGQDIKLDEDILVIADDKDALAIAGVKGGNKAEVDENTKNIVLESANFEPSNIRLTSRKVGILTDSSKRFEQDISASLSERGIDAVSGLILEMASTEETKMGEKKDFYPRKPGSYKVGVSLSQINRSLGTDIDEKEVVDIFNRLNFEVEKINPLKKVLEFAPQFEGVPYKYGASVSYDAPRLFDCTSFTAYLFAQGGVAIPRMTVDQYFYGQEVKEADLQAGDIVFSNTNILKNKIHYESIEFMPGSKIPEGIDHCGLYLGNGKIIHVSSFNSDGTMIEDLDKSEQFKDPRGFRRMTDNEERFVVTVPAERLDIRISEDLIEEVGRIYGYENIKGVLPKGEKVSSLNKEFFYKDIIRGILADEGFSEVHTYSFVENGDNKKHRELLNPLANNRPFMRHNLSDEMRVKLDKNTHYGDLLGIDKIKIFEIGKVFDKEGEREVLGLTTKHLKKKAKKEEELEESLSVLRMVFEKFGISCEIGKDSIKVSGKKVGEIIDNIIEVDLDMIFSFVGEDREKEFLPESILGSISGSLYAKSPDVSYKKISKYPFVSRDISLFVSPDTNEKEVQDLISKEAGEMFANIYLFDTFQKEDKKSLAFRVIFQSHDKTLEDSEINKIMEKITSVLMDRGFQIR